MTEARTFFVLLALISAFALPQIIAASLVCDGDTCTAPVLKIGVVGAGTKAFLFIYLFFNN